LAAMALGSGFMFISFASLCMSDMLLLVLDTASLTLLYAGAVSERRRLSFWLLAAASMGLAFLIKGPVGFVLPSIAFLSYLFVLGEQRIIKPIHVLLGIAVFVVIASPWLLAAYWANGAGSMAYFFLHENLERFAGASYDVHRPIWFTLLSFFSGFAPWSVVLPVCAWDSARRFREIRLLGTAGDEARRRLYLWIWIVCVLGFFTFSRGKIDYYVLPAYPAAAMLLGLYVSKWIKERARPAIYFGWTMATCLLVCGSVAGFFVSGLAGGSSPSHWLVMPITLLLSGALSGLAMYHRQLIKAYCLASLGLMLAATGFSLQILPVIAELNPAGMFAGLVEDTPSGTRVGVHKAFESSIDEILFQTGRDPIKLDDAAQLNRFLSDSRPAIVLCPASELRKLPRQTLAAVRVLDQRPCLFRAVNPGYAIARMGRLANDKDQAVALTN